MPEKINSIKNKIRFFYTSDFLSTGSSKFFILLVSLISSIFLTRFMGPQIKGEYAYLINVVSLATVILNFGIYQSYPTLKNQGIKNLQDKYISLFIFQFIILISVFISILLLFNISQVYSWGLILIPIMLLTNQMSFLFIVDDIKRRNIAIVLGSFSYLLATIILYYFFQSSLYPVILILIFKELITLLILLINYKIKINIYSLNKKLIKKIFSFGLFAAASQLLLVLNYKIDIFILKPFVPLTELGYYSLGAGMAALAWIIPDIFKETLLSRISKKNYIAETTISLRLSLTISYIILLVILFFGKDLIVLLYGDSFTPAYKVTVYLFVGIIGMIFYKIIGNVFLVRGDKKMVLYTLLVGSVMNILLNYILIPRFGIIGAAVASLISYSTCGFYLLFSYCKLFTVKLQDVLLVNFNDVNLVKKEIRKTRQ